MSNYAFFCLDCQEEFTQHMNMSDYEKVGYEKDGLTCPKCGGHRVTQKVEAFSAVTARKS